MIRTLAIFVLAPAFILVAQDDAKIAATDTETLKAREGDTVVVTGLIDRTGKAAAGINFLNFKDSEFVCVTFAQQVANFEDGAPADIFKGKWVEVRGKIEIFKGKPQIRLEDPSQITVIEAPSTTAEPKPKPPSAAVDPEPEPAPVLEAPKIAANPAATAGPELVNGEPPVDWRNYFPE